jgi:hypothetical protein
MLPMAARLKAEAVSALTNVICASYVSSGGRHRRYRWSSAGLSAFIGVTSTAETGEYSRPNAP